MRSTSPSWLWPKWTSRPVPAPHARHNLPLPLETTTDVGLAPRPAETIPVILYRRLDRSFCFQFFCSRGWARGERAYLHAAAPPSCVCPSMFEVARPESLSLVSRRCCFVLFQAWGLLLSTAWGENTSHWLGCVHSDTTSLGDEALRIKYLSCCMLSLSREFGVFSVLPSTAWGGKRRVSHWPNFICILLVGVDHAHTHTKGLNTYKWFTSEVTHVFTSIRHRS